MCWVHARCFKCQSFLTGKKQQEVRIEWEASKLPHSGSLARQCSSTLTFPTPVPQSDSQSSIINHDGELCSTNSDGCLFLLQRQVVPQLSCLFASLLADQTWLIHQHALEAFTHFAEVSRAQLWVQAFGSVNFCCTPVLLTQMFAAPHCTIWSWVTAVAHWKCWGWCNWKRFQELEMKKDWALLA